jgi:UDP-3-O-[3-hydroxymyristoyl] glucosamine N-acyltransferase
MSVIIQENDFVILVPSQVPPSLTQEQRFQKMKQIRAQHIRSQQIQNRAQQGVGFEQGSRMPDARTQQGAIEQNHHANSTLGHPQMIAPQPMTGPQQMIGSQQIIGPQPVIGPQPIIGPQQMTSSQQMIGSQQKMMGTQQMAAFNMVR